MDILHTENTKEAVENKRGSAEEVELTADSFDVICRTCMEKKEVFAIADVHWEDIWLRDILYDLFRPKEKTEKTLPQNMCQTCIEEIYVVNQFLQKYHHSTKVLLEIAKSEEVEIIYIHDPSRPERETNNQMELERENQEPLHSSTENIIDDNLSKQNDIGGDKDDKMKNEAETDDETQSQHPQKDTELFYETPDQNNIEKIPSRDEKQNYPKEDSQNKDDSSQNEENNRNEDDNLFLNGEDIDYYQNSEVDNYSNEDLHQEQFIEDYKPDIVEKDDDSQDENVDDPNSDDDVEQPMKKKKKKKIRRLGRGDGVATHDLFTEKPPEASNKDQLSLKDVWYMCSTCDAPFNNYLKLEEHKSQKSHKEMQIFVCPFPGCEKKFRWHSRFVDHFRVHIDERPYECNVCQKSFRTATEASAHVRQTHLNIAPHICDICERAFKRKVHLDMHRKTHTGERTVCSYCGKSFSTYSLYMHEQRHKIALGLMKPKPKPEKTGPKAEFQCHLCSQTLSSKHCLEQHIIRHGPKCYKCDECGKSYSSDEYLKSHINAKHTYGEYICPFCNRDLKQKYLLEQHQKKEHPGEKLHLFTCETCEKTFSNSISFNEHVKVHKGQTNHYCDQCDRYFASESKLNRHIRVHTGEKPFGCTVCEKKFASKDYLKIHAETHKPTHFVCQICSARFTDNRSYKAHLTVHSYKDSKRLRERRIKEERHKIEAPVTEEIEDSSEEEAVNNYHCGQCGKSFADEQLLFDHVQIEHNDDDDVTIVEDIE